MRSDADLFPYLALALAQWAKHNFIPLPPHMPHVETWRTTFSKLAMRMNMRCLKETQFPQWPSLDHVPELFTHPLRQWYPDPLETLPEEIDPDLPLLHEPLLDETSLDEQLILYLEHQEISNTLSSYALQTTLDQHWMRELVRWGRKDTATREADYRVIRRFLIEHPWTTDTELQTNLSRLRIYNPAVVGDKYEQASVFDSIVRHDGLYWICPHCGGFLLWKHGRASCAKHICERLYPEYQGMQPIMPRLNMRRLNWGLHVRVCLPGKTEMTLYERLHSLEAAGIHVVLWPGVDVYDLRIDFPSGQRWAIDVKDYESPRTLARALLKDPFPRCEERPDLQWQQAFYVIPSYRLQLVPDYLRIVRELTRRQMVFQNVTFCDEEELYQQVTHALAASSLIHG